MVKKLFFLALGLLAVSGIMAQSAPKSVNIVESNIQYWVGTGSNSTVIAIGWDDEDASYTPTVVVWGIHWNGTITLLDALDTLMAYDSRFTYTISGSFLSTVSYVDASASVSLTPSASYNCNNYNGVYGSTNLSTSTWLRISESTCSNYDFTTVNNLIYADDPNGGSSTADTVDATIAFSDILYWVGTGSDSAVFIVNFAQPDTAFAWGYLFNGTTTAQAMVDAIAAADPRFWTEGSPSVSGDIHFVTDNGDTLGLSPVDPDLGYNFWWTNLNGVSVSTGANCTLHNGDVFKYGDLNSATGWNEMYGFYMEEAWSTAPTPVPAPSTDPMPEDAEIAASDIIYWVGEGSNKVVFAINWADTALAWGYQFSTDSVYVSEIIDALVAADPRLSIEGSSSFVSDFRYADENITDTLTITPHAADDYSIYFNMQVNHVSSMIGAAGHAVVDGDFVKFADTYVAVKADSTWIEDWGGYWDYTYVWPMEIHPVSVPVESTPEDAEIAASDIIYWVGEGSNKVVFAINWADTALAWGYQFSTDSVYVSEIIDALVAADPRLSIEGTSSFVSDFRYADENITDTLTITPHAADDYSIYFNMQVNHVSSMVGAAGHAVVNGDFVKFADTYVAVKADSTWIEDWGGYWDYTYVWPMEIHPVSVPSSSSIAAVEGMNVNVYPNPAVSSIMVSFNALERASDIELYDMTGRRVAVYPVAAGSTSLHISVEGLANGIYMLRMADATAKVIVR